MDRHTAIESSFLALYEQFADMIFRHCYFRVSSRETAEDLTQESFMRIWNHLAEGKTIDNPKAFLYRIAGNMIIDYYRKKKNMSLDALSDEGFDPVGDDASSTLAFAEGQRLRSVAKELESPYREVIFMRYVDDFSISDIARATGESENVISVRIHRGIEKLKKLYKHENSN